MTEFGTLEIISTVETEKGEITWSTPTEHGCKSANDEANSIVKESPGIVLTKKDEGKKVEQAEINPTKQKGGKISCPFTEYN